LDLVGADTTRLQVVFITITRNQLADLSRNITSHTFTGRLFRARDATRLAEHNSAHFVFVANAIALDSAVISSMSTVSGVLTIKFDRCCGLSL